MLGGMNSRRKVGANPIQQPRTESKLKYKNMPSGKKKVSLRTRVIKKLVQRQGKKITRLPAASVPANAPAKPAWWKRAITGGLDLGALGATAFYPDQSASIGRSRQMIRDTFGFDSTRVGQTVALSGAGAMISDGGPVVQSASAPVAFARSSQIRPFMHMTNGVHPDEVMVHVVEQAPSGNDVIGVKTAFTVVVNQPVSPQNTNVFTQSDPIANLYSKYRAKLLRVHYVHFCPTSVPGRVGICFRPDTQALSPLSMADITKNSNSVIGGAYEDFSLEVDLSSVQQDWLFSDYITGDGTNATLRQEFCGDIFIATDMGASSTAASIGSYYVEVVWEFASRVAADQDALILNRYLRALQKDQRFTMTQKLELVCPKLTAYLDWHPPSSVREFPILTELNNAFERLNNLELKTGRTGADLPMAVITNYPRRAG